MAKQVKGELRIPGIPRKGGVICGCGKFIARLIPEGVEIKCRGCRNLVVISRSDIQKCGSWSTEEAQASSLNLADAVG